MLWFLLVAGVVVVGGGALAIERVTRQPQGSARLLAMPRTAIADAADGAEIRIEGTVELAAATLPTPLVPDDRCVLYEHEAWIEPERSWLPTSADEPPPAEPRRIRHACEAVPFLVRDDSGAALVTPAGVVAHLRLLAHDQHDGATLDLGGPRYVEARTLAAGNAVAETVAAVRPGARVAVVGRVSRPPVHDAPAGTLVELGHSRRLGLHVFELDDEGGAEGG